MELRWIEGNDKLPTTEPLIAAISIDESHAVLGLLDGYPEVVEIPKRYRRHFNYMADENF